MNPLLVALISTCGALLGVLFGSWLTSRNQKRERQITVFREQLSGFYGPMLAIRAESLAKAELRLKISGAAGEAWRGLIEQARREGGVDAVREVRNASFPMFAEIIKEDNRQLAEEIMPSYRKMVQCFVENMHFAEVSTIGYLEELIEFVGIWDRWFADSLPTEVVQLLGHSEEKLYPLYVDIASHFVTLQGEIKERRRWWHRERRARINVVPRP